MHQHQQTREQQHESLRVQQRRAPKAGCAGSVMRPARTLALRACTADSGAAAAARADAGGRKRATTSFGTRRSHTLSVRYVTPSTHVTHTGGKESGGAAAAAAAVVPGFAPAVLPLRPLPPPLRAPCGDAAEGLAPGAAAPRTRPMRRRRRETATAAAKACCVLRFFPFSRRVLWRSGAAAGAGVSATHAMQRQAPAAAGRGRRLFFCRPPAGGARPKAAVALLSKTQLALLLSGVRCSRAAPLLQQLHAPRGRRRWRCRLPRLPRPWTQGARARLRRVPRHLKQRSVP
jgi:hypothetical protein